ncbi:MULTISPECIES: hypothetical protein [unclassified Meridianimarinicoccus]|nr:hypothetical protein [Fluviibacterium sp. MJW13]
MKPRLTSVFGHRIPSPRATPAGLFWLAALMSVPVFVLLSLLEAVLRWLL